MKSLLIAAAVAASLFGPANAATTIINFDDLAVDTDVGTQVPGFSFTGFLVASGFGETSEPNFAYNTLEVASVDVAGGFTAFSFTAGVFTPATVSVFSELGGAGTLLGSFALANPPFDPSAFQTGGVSFSGTGKSVVVSAGAAQFGWDDLTFESGVVPEPATWAMLIVGFGLVGTAARRRRTIATA